LKGLQTTQLIRISHFAICASNNPVNNHGLINKWSSNKPSSCRDRSYSIYGHSSNSLYSEGSASLMPFQMILMQFHTCPILRIYIRYTHLNVILSFLSSSCNGPLLNRGLHHKSSCISWLLIVATCPANRKRLDLT
jgi:hypothetical protein